MTFRFSASAFLNSAPLLEGMISRPDVTVVHAEPSRQAAALRDGSVDAALVPIVDCLFAPDLAMIEGLGVCARDKVRSVCLRCHVPLSDVRTVLLDPASHTSNLLVQLMLTEFYGRTCSFVASGEADAEVVIGDRALSTPPGAGGDHDLAEAWRKTTGLPFVFAVWVHRADHPAAAKLAAIARESLEEGRRRLPEIAERYAAGLGLAKADCLEYLTDCVHHDVGEEERKGMARFRAMLLDRGLVAGQSR